MARCGAAGTDAAAIGFDKLANVGVLYPGLEIMGGGAILTGLVLAAIAARDRQEFVGPRHSLSPARC